MTYEKEHILITCVAYFDSKSFASAWLNPQQPVNHNTAVEQQYSINLDLSVEGEKVFSLRMKSLIF